MRKILLFVTLFVSLFVLCACNTEDMGSLSDLSKPYAGQYECTTLTLGGEDQTKRFEYIRLELDSKGSFRLSYRTTEGSEGSYGGTYEMDTETNEITFTAKTPLRSVSRKFPVEKGKICIDLNFQGRLLHAEFGMP